MRSAELSRCRARARAPCPPCHEGVAAQHAGAAGHALRQDRVAFVGHADEPSGPCEGLFDSRTSVRCRWRTSSVNFSSEPPRWRAPTKRRRDGRAAPPGGDGLVSPVSSAQTSCSTGGRCCCRRPRRAQLAHGGASVTRRRRPRSRSTRGPHAQLHAEGDGSAWMPCVRPTCTVSRNSKARRLSTSPRATSRAAGARRRA